ncbi:MAG: acyl-CoA carboxylase subunit epsilon [bacterium]
MSEAMCVVRGRPTDQEVAALVAVVLSRTTTADASRPPPSLWRDRTTLLRAPLLARRGAWRASALPS